MMFQSVPNDGFGIDMVKPIRISQENEKVLNLDDEAYENKENVNSFVDEGVPGLEELKENKNFEEIHEVKKAIQENIEKIEENNEKTEEKFEKIEENFEKTEEKAEKEEEKVEKTEENVEKIQENLEEIDKFKTQESKKTQEEISIKDMNNKTLTNKNEIDCLPPEIPEESKENLPNTESKNPEAEEKKLFKDMDEMILAVFLTAIKIGIPDTSLPLEPSALLNIMTRCKRKLEINFSQSSYKKIGKFLSFVHSKSLIKYEKPKSHDHKLITSIDRSHPLLYNFVPIVSKMKGESKESESSEPDFKYPKVAYTSGLILKQRYLSIFSQQIPHKSLNFFLKPEVNNLLQEYIEVNKLEQTKQTVKLDSALKKALNSEEEIKKSDLYKKFKDLFEDGYIEEYTSGLMPNNTKVGQIPSIFISLENSVYKKVITRIKGCDDYLVDMKQLLKVSQKTLAASAALVEKASKNKTKVELQIQGDHLIKMSEILVEHFKIPKSCVVVKKNR